MDVKVVRQAMDVKVVRQAMDVKVVRQAMDVNKHKRRKPLTYRKSLSNFIT
jgi:hypothetical protein